MRNSRSRSVSRAPMRRASQSAARSSACRTKCVVAPERKTLDDVCGSVADGASIDWKALDPPARSGRRELLEQASKIVSDIASAHRLLEFRDGARRPEPAVSRMRSGKQLAAGGGTCRASCEQLGEGPPERRYPRRGSGSRAFHRHQADSSNRAREERSNDARAPRRPGDREGQPSQRGPVYGVEVHDGRVGLCMGARQGQDPRRDCPADPG